MMGLVYPAFVLAVMLFSVLKRRKWDDADP